MSINRVLIFIVLTSILKEYLNKKSIEEIRKIKRPENIDDETYCASCFIIVKTCKERIKDTYKEHEILSVVSDSFTQKKGFYSQYKHFKARTLRDASELFVYSWDSYIEKFFLNWKNKEKNAIQELCYKKTAACEGVWKIDEIESNMLKANKDDL